MRGNLGPPCEGSDRRAAITAEVIGCVTAPLRAAAIDTRSNFGGTASIVAPFRSRATMTVICSPDSPRLAERSLAPIGNPGTDRAQFGNVFLKGTHTSSDSEFAARRKAAAGDSGPSAEEGCAKWHLRLTPTQAGAGRQRDPIALRTAAAGRA
jgi:hypothetical protein